MADEPINAGARERTDLDALAAHWPDITPWSPRSTGWGTINQTFLVGGEADPHVLKLYGANADPAQLRYENRVLAGLNGLGLLFSVPLPRPAASGETLVPVAGVEGVVASLFPFLRGEAVRRGDLRHTYQAGAAMGVLHRGLAALDIPPGDAVLPPWGDLARVHPLVADPFAVAGGIGLDADAAEELGGLIADVVEAIASLSPDLPRQVTHADYLWPNLLFQDGLVSAVLDFEFATYDLRAFDLAGSLYHFGMLPWKDGERWDLLQAFGGGYGKQVSLTREEVEALPMLLRWQRLSGLVYWAGVYHQGLTSRQSLVDAVEENLLLEGWLLAHGQELVKRSHAWLGTKL